MTRHTPDPSRPRPPGTEGSVLTPFAVVAATFALVWAVSFPLIAASVVVAAALAAGLARVGLSALGSRLRGRAGRVSVPGLGTVEFRVSPR